MGKKGEGVVHATLPIYIPDCVPGDEVEFKIIKVLKRRAFARLIRVIKPSPHRVVAKCSVAKPCGGCQLQCYSQSLQVRLKSDLLKSRLQRFLDIPDTCFKPMVYGDEWQTRNKMQFALAEGEHGLQIGLYAHRSHRVVDIAYCEVMPDAMNQVLKSVKAWHSNNPIPVFNEQTADGILRFLTIRYSSATNQLMVILTVVRPFNMDSFIDALAGMKGMASVYVSVQADPTRDHVLGPSLTCVWGAATIADVVHGCACQVSPDSFMQANHTLVSALYDVVLKATDGRDSVLDCYCGTGVLTCLMAKRGLNVTGVDIHKPAIQNAIENAQNNQVLVEFKCMDAMAYIQTTHKTFDTMVIDPPRKGCDSDFLNAAIDGVFKQIIYVSCYPDTLGRDLRQLVDGGYRIDSVQGVDMFCHTPHIECVVVLKR